MIEKIFLLHYPQTLARALRNLRLIVASQGDVLLYSHHGLIRCLDLPKLAVPNPIGPLGCGRQEVRPISFLVLPPLSKCFLWDL